VREATKRGHFGPETGNTPPAGGPVGKVEGSEELHWSFSNKANSNGVSQNQESCNSLDSINPNNMLSPFPSPGLKVKPMKGWRNS
jgi:hypothetical protein